MIPSGIRPAAGIKCGHCIQLDGKCVVSYSSDGGGWRVDWVYLLPIELT